MHILNNKYKEFYSALFVAVYVIFLIINFTHSHHFNISNSLIVISNNNVNEVDSLLLDGSSCLIHQFSSSVLFLEYSNATSLNIINIENSSIYKSNFFFNSIIFVNSPLRAPPVDFSV
ncbi:MAG: hypothetical protein V3V16_11075 [Melioribacteraceae bacterium]